MTPPTELREALAKFLYEKSWRELFQASFERAVEAYQQHGVGCALGTALYAVYQDADALLAGPLSDITRQAAEAQREREGLPESPDNDYLRFIGAFDRKTTVGKHLATHRQHLRDTVQALDAVGHAPVADTLVWLVWHRVNDQARHSEYHRIISEDRDTARAEAARLQAEIEGLKAALTKIAAMQEGYYAPKDWLLQELKWRPSAAAIIARAALNPEDADGQ